MNTDEEWEKWGKTDPYFGVITHEKFRRHNLTKEARSEFFETGRIHVNHILEVCRRRLDQNFAPKRILDFGCGVGRLVIPFAALAEHVVGLDVSDSMLNEALKNCNEHALQNVSLFKSDENLSAVDGYYDLIHSFIVFQHIPVERGSSLFSNLLNHLAPGGIGAIQITYSKTISVKSDGLPPVAPRPALHEKTEPPHRDPEMQMNPYDINELFSKLQSSGMRDVYLEFTDHGGELGVFLYFQKPGMS